MEFENGHGGVGVNMVAKKDLHITPRINLLPTWIAGIHIECNFDSFQKIWTPTLMRLTNIL